MKHLKALITGLRAFLIAAIAGGGAAAQAQRAAGTGEEAAWNAARAAGTVGAYERYLELYPVGRYAEEAFRCVVELSIDPGAACSIDPGVGGAEGRATRSIVTRGVAADIY
jgi:hypothetical protein